MSTSNLIYTSDNHCLAESSPYSVIEPTPDKKALFAKAVIMAKEFLSKIEADNNSRRVL